MFVKQREKLIMGPKPHEQMVNVTINKREEDMMTETKTFGSSLD
jgi:hypothetical protein